MKRFRRFLHIEGKRAARESEDHATDLDRRFDDFPAKQDATTESTPTVDTGRIEIQVSETPLGLDFGTSQPPFLRCMHCQKDNGRFQKCCDDCQSDLTTPEQNDYHADIWKKISASNIQAASEAELRRQTREKEGAGIRDQADAARHALGIELARLEQLRYVRTLGKDPLAIVLWREIPSPRIKGVVLAGVVVFCVLLAFTRWRILLLVLVSALATPRNTWTSRE